MDNLQRAIKKLSATKLADDTYAYWDDATQAYWKVSELELERLSQYPNYSLWCSSTHATQMPEDWEP